jgi:6-phosphogluconolactonase
MERKLYIFETPAKLADQFADKMMEWIESHSANTFHLAISGGKTPDLLFAALASKHAESSNWKKVHFWWVDERMVPTSHPESNFGVVQRLLFSQISIPEVNIHRIKGENNPAIEAHSYSMQIQETLPETNGWPMFDLILLGMGEDGHTASIFPNQMGLLQSEHICAVAAHPESGQKRITLTGKVINNAHKICFLITGANKANRMNEIFTNQSLSIRLPASQILALNGELIWYADKSAVELL